MAPPAAAAGFLRVEQVGKAFGELPAVRDVSLQVSEGEIFALLGASGCGKSTLLRMIAGLERPDRGRIVLDGVDLAFVPAHRRPTNMMFQSYALFPHLSVESNVAFGLRQERPRMPPDALRARVAEMLELVQLTALARRRPHELSGGQQQRVALARSLAREPKLLLLDEPLSALDKKIRQRTQLELVALVRRVGVTCIMVTHDQDEAMTMADRIGVMSPQGELLQVGTPGELYERPGCRYVAEFVGEANLFAGRVGGDRLHAAAWPRPLVLPPAHGLADGAEAWLSVRPERLRLSRTEPPADDDNRATATVTAIAYLGSHSVYHLRAGGEARELVVDVPRAHWGEAPPPAQGDSVWVSWPGPEGVVLTR